MRPRRTWLERGMMVRLPVEDRMKRLIVTVASLLLLLPGVSAAGAFGPSATDGLRPPVSTTPAADPPGLRSASSDGTGGLLGPRTLVDRLLPVAATVPGGDARNPLSGLAGGAFAGYGRGTAFA